MAGFWLVSSLFWFVLLLYGGYVGLEVEMRMVNQDETERAGDYYGCFLFLALFLLPIWKGLGIGIYRDW